MNYSNFSARSNVAPRLVFCRDNRFAIELPVDSQCGIIPGNCALVLGRVKIGRFIEHVGIGPMRLESHARIRVESIE